MCLLRRVTTATGYRALAVVLSAFLTIGLAVAMSATPASADPLPTTFQIRSVEYGQCAYPQSSAPHYVRMNPCSATDPSEQWFWNPVTGQVTNASVATTGLCLDYEPAFLDLVMTTCSTSVPTQGWDQFTYNGAQYLAQANGSAHVVTSRAPGNNWNAYIWESGSFYLPGQNMTFPLL